MALSLLGICSAALARMTLPTVTTIIDNTSGFAPMLLALATQGAQDLSRRAAWKALTREKTFTTVATAAQTSAIPSDLDWIIPETMFNRTKNRMVEGPISQSEWQRIQASQATSVYPSFRIRGSSLLITPTPTAGDTVAYEYITKNFCTTTNGDTEQDEWEDDTDIPVLDSELHVLSLIYRFKESQGLSFQTEQATFERQVALALQREGVRPRISTDGPFTLRKRGEVIPGEAPDVIVTDGGDYIGY